MRRLMIWIGIFIMGYLFGQRQMPMGMELLIMMGISFGAGLFVFTACAKIKRAAYKWFLRFFNSERTLRLLGCQISIKKHQQFEPQEPGIKLVKPKRTEPKPLKLDLEPGEVVPAAPACDLCQGEEEIRLAGQKIKCPKCKSSSQRRLEV